LDYGRQILCIDPFREAVFCEVICLCMMSGQRVKAMRMYECFVVALDAELGIAPMAETRALYDHIKQDRPPEAPWCAEASEPMRRTQPGTLGDRLHQIEHARLALYRAMSTATH
ncbi:MAG: bacterial transcriptional activator domain-containing protein, partial [Pseudomonadota bacterium]